MHCNQHLAPAKFSAVSAARHTVGVWKKQVLFFQATGPLATEKK